ncbi:RNA degradosome polyphosphate kinase [Vibrio cyclitrophicus ZF205]|uniref:polyphosphate kinase 1 n=1 Tax=Vibrio cyclitrophicus TaxID=47951 RepID=UPI00030D7ECA|nr:polyphosphate kinase 1 [Vibrio cyclitrophicus]OEE18407.1 RNA degradosome polyphosphate kinase [Vibrio cyclitrophicus ZF205]
MEKDYVTKELSWLSFNERVLQEAADKSVPLIERVRFLGIYSKNLDEFYKVRFADVKRKILLKDPPSTNVPKTLLTQMQNKIRDLEVHFHELYNDLLLELARNRIFLVNEQQISTEQSEWVRKYFRKKILPHLTPLLLNEDSLLLNTLKDDQSYLAIDINRNRSSQYALLEIPSEQLPRFVKLPETSDSQRTTLILLDNIVRFCLDDLLKGFFDYDSLSCFAIKMTRDADYDLQKDYDFQKSNGLLEAMSLGLEQRLTALPIRLIYESEMPSKMLSYLRLKLKLSDYDSVIAGGRYHNFKHFSEFPSLNRHDLINRPLSAIKCAQFNHYPNYFEAIKARDILLHYPYHTFDHITELVRQASFDPKVKAIKINVYRVAKGSKLLNSIIDAAHNGKKVTVVVELQARFDEQANIQWAKTLQDAGVKVLHGLPSLKIHSKLLLIKRKNGKALEHYAHIGTGNFHEVTARVYTDFSLLTANEELTQEVRQVFRYIENPYQKVQFKQLIVSPKNTRKRLYQLIDNEIQNAANDKPASITLKLNNLVDREIIEKLYQASQANVKVRMIIRGMCSLVPGLPNVSDNIEIISVIDRFLEHPRVMIFGNNDNPKVYISSADWMTRNFDRRIEVATPILDPKIKQTIIDITEFHFDDCNKARRLDRTMSNHYLPPQSNRLDDSTSQLATYHYIKHIEKLARKKYKQENKSCS